MPARKKYGEFALAVPGQSNAASVTASTKATDAASVAYSIGPDNTRTISFKGLAAQGTYQTAVGSVNNFFGTAPATKASKHLGPKGRHPVVGPVDKVCRFGPNCIKQGKGCKYQHPATDQPAAVPNKWKETCLTQSKKIKELRQIIKEKDDEIALLRAQLASLNVQTQQQVQPAASDQDDDALLAAMQQEASD